jgi:hypothetical protein
VNSPIYYLKELAGKSYLAFQSNKRLANQKLKRIKKNDNQDLTAINFDKGNKFRKNTYYSIYL